MIYFTLLLIIGVQSFRLRRKIDRAFPGWL